MAEEAEAAAPLRTCAVTRTVHPTAELIRFVRAPDGTVVPDLRHRLPGRGVWIGAARTTVEQAVRRKVFGRGFRAEVAVPPDLAAAVEDQLARAVQEALAMANKAGLVVTGFARVEAALGTGEVAALLHAGDAAADGVRKLDAAARRRGIVVISPLEGAALDLALGRANVVHAALLAGPLSEVVVTRANDLDHYRNNDRPAAGHDKDDTGRPAGTDTE